VELWALVLYGVGALLLLYALLVVTLVLSGRWSAARAVASFLPDFVVLVKRLLRDPRVPRRQKFLLAVLVGYMAMPFDLILDAIPVIGELDDAVLAALVLRSIMRSAGEGLVRELWPGRPEALEVLITLAFGRSSLRKDARP
jgi:uncharacterized membrane protein YkvA (DUF1232 family)